MLERIRQKIAITKNSDMLQPYQLRLQHVAAYDGFNIPVSVLGSGTPVLMVHAFGMDARQFLPFILPLASQFCFYLPHLRGWGLSANAPSTQFDFIEQYADDIEVLLTHICSKHDTSSVDVAAISMGALVMWAYFNRHPNDETSINPKTSLNQETAINQATQNGSQPNDNKVRRYLNIDQSPIVHNQPDWQGGVFGEKQDEVFAQFEEVLATTLPYVNAADFNSTVMNSMVRDNLIKNGTMMNGVNGAEHRDFRHLPYPVKRKIIDMENAFSLMSVDRLSSRWLVRATGYQPSHKMALYEHKTWRQKLLGLQAYLTLPYDYRSALATTTTPVTMLIGGQSQLYDPVWQRKVADILPNAEVIEVPESGHAIPLDAPLRFTHLLKQFLNQS